MRVDMSAQGRLGKANRQLVKLRALHPRIGQDPQARQEFIDTAEDCLITLRSVPDHLLEEANQTYRLGVGLKERLYPSSFRKKAMNNQPALDYHDWHTAEQERIETTSTYGLPLDRRDLAVHRVETPLAAIIGLSGNLRPTGALELKHIDRAGEEREVIPSFPDVPATRNEDERKITVYWGFPEIPDRDALDVLEDLYSRMRQFVVEAKNRIGSTGLSV